VSSALSGDGSGFVDAVEAVAQLGALLEFVDE